MQFTPALDERFVGPKLHGSVVPDVRRNTLRC